MAKDELEERKAKRIEKEKKVAMPRVKNASFFLFREQNGSLSPLGAFETLPDVRFAYESLLDEDIPENQLKGFKGRFLKFEVKETKRRIMVR